MKIEQLIPSLNLCNACEAHLPLGPRPIYQLHSDAKILIASQAPGRAAHISGIAFDDPSGRRLRDWMGLNDEAFYTPAFVAILPMGMCYPGKASSGDLPPRKECAPLWREKLLAGMSNIKLSLIIGKHALNWHLPEHKQASLKDIVSNQCLDEASTIVLPHPSPRNNIWLAKNPWFERDIVPKLRARVSEILMRSEQFSV